MGFDFILAEEQLSPVCKGRRSESSLKTTGPDVSNSPSTAGPALSDLSIPERCSELGLVLERTLLLDYPKISFIFT